MNVQTLAGTLQLLSSLDTSIQMQRSLDAALSQLENLVQQPANPPFQQSLASALATLETAAKQLQDRISPPIEAVIKELGGERFFDPGIADGIKATISANAMTPSVARDSLKKLVNERSAFLKVIDSTLDGLGNLGIKGEKLSAGSAEMAFLVPREIFDNKLGSFAKELLFFDRLLNHVGEALNVEAEVVELKNVSSSIPTITIHTALVAMTTIGDAVNKFLEAWKKVSEIRTILAKLKSLGLANKATGAELTEEITTTITQVVDESTTSIIIRSTVAEARKHELDGLIRKDLKKLFSDIERGLIVEIRAEPADNNKAADVNLERLKQLSSLLQFPAMTNDPLLLSSGEEEDMLVAHNKSTRTTTTQTTKKRISSKPEAETES